MSCKIIDDLMIANDYDQSAPEIVKHLAVCNECNVMITSMDVLESNLKDLYKSREYPHVLGNRIMSNISKGKRSNYGIYAACLLIIVLITFRHDIVSFAKDLPIIELLIEAFERDEVIQTVINNDYPVIKDLEKYYVTSLDGYRLYLKDIYVDDENIRMQMACSDPNGKLLIDPLFEVASGREVIRTSKVAEGNVWISFESDNLAIPVNSDEMYLNVRVLSEENKIWFEPFTIDVSHTLKDKVYYYPMDETYNLDVGTIEIKELIVTPVDIKVVYDIELKKEYHYFKWENFTIEDSFGNVYDQYRFSGDLDHQIMVFEGTDYFEIPVWYKLKADGYSVNNVTMLTVEKAVDTPFVYNDHPFTFKVIDSDSEYNNDYGYIKTNIPTEASNYPMMLLRGYNSWLNMFDEDEVPTFKRYILTKATVEHVIGENFEVDSHTLNTLNKFIEAYTGYKAIADSLLEALSTLQNQDSSVVELDLPKIDSMKLLIYREGNLREMFGYLDEKLEREFDLMIDVNIE